MNVHSINPVGGQRMHDKLFDAGFDVKYIPFDKGYARFLR